MYCRITEHIPELLEMSITSGLFTPTEPSSDSNPVRMASNFGCSYLGKLPMDPNMLTACEEGYAFVELFPNSYGAIAFNKIVEKIVSATEMNEISMTNDSVNPSTISLSIV